MLVLTRKLMEKLYIGEDVCITVVRLEGGQVRLGIEAPREVAVVRAELIPERAGELCRQACRTPHASVSGELKRPPLSVHGNDSRRREPSR